MELEYKGYRIYYYKICQQKHRKDLQYTKQINKRCKSKVKIQTSVEHLHKITANVLLLFENKHFFHNSDI